jgi:Protein of unknown function (DUF3109)
MMGTFSLQVVNLAEARYECTYGRGCDGVCCQEGHPLVYPDEIERTDANLHKFWPLLRPEAKKAIDKKGYLMQRRRFGERVVRSAGGWCVFFNQGCVLHKVGAQEQDPFKYKPAVCALFPIQMDEQDRWYVRQKGYNGEKWNLFCLDPESTTVPAAESLQREIALARRFAEEESAQ